MGLGGLRGGEHAEYDGFDAALFDQGPDLRLQLLCDLRGRCGGRQRRELKA